MLVFNTLLYELPSPTRSTDQRTTRTSTCLLAVLDMAGPNLDMDLLSSIERTGDKTTLGFGGPVQAARGNGQTQQFSGVLIKLFKVPVWIH